MLSEGLIFFHQHHRAPSQWSRKPTLTYFSPSGTLPICVNCRLAACPTFLGCHICASSCILEDVGILLSSKTTPQSITTPETFHSSGYNRIEWLVLKTEPHRYLACPIPYALCASMLLVGVDRFHEYHPST